MEALLGILAFYAVVAAIIEASLKGLERVGEGFFTILYKKEDAKALWSKLWGISVKVLMIVCSIAIVWKIGIFAIQIFAINVLQLDPSFSIGAWDPILTGLLVSRGSNVINKFIVKLSPKTANA